MKTLGFIFSLLVSLTALAKDGYKVTKKNLKGDAVIKEVLTTESDWLTLSSGDDERGNTCHSYILVNNEKDFLEVVLVDIDQSPKARFYVSKSQSYEFTREESNDSAGGGIGFHTYDTYKIGKNSLTFDKAGDSYYEVTIQIGEKTISCLADF